MIVSGMSLSMSCSGGKLLYGDQGVGPLTPLRETAKVAPCLHGTQASRSFWEIEATFMVLVTPASSGTITFPFQLIV